MAEKKITQKKLKIDNAVSSITRIEGFLATYQPNLQHEVEPRLSRLEILFSTFEELSGEYESFDEKLVEDSLKLRAKVEEQYLRVKSGLITKLQPETRRQAHPPEAPIAQHLKLPTIELPKFDGNIHEWITFHDTFNAIIHSSADISQIQKLQYLRSSLRGDALKCIETLPISAANYPIAWEALLTKYQDKPLLKKKHLHGLTSINKPHGKVASLGPCVEDFHRNVKILEQLGEPVQHWDTILIHLLSLRVDSRTLRDWEEDHADNPTYKQFTEYLNKKVKIQETIALSSDRTTTPRQPSVNSKLAAHATTEKRIPRCVACNADHYVSKCGAFEKMPHKEKLSIVQSKRLCNNCLYPGHIAKNCQSQMNCRACGKRHHTWLHPGHESPKSSPKENEQAEKSSSMGPDKHEQRSTIASTSSTLTTNAALRSINVFLSTVVLIIVDRFGKEHLARALLDSASQANLISKRLQQLLRLNLHKANIEITGVDGTSTQIQHTSITHIRSRINNMSVPVEFLVVNKVTSDLPTVSVTTMNWNIPPEIKLADPEFHVSRNVDMIIGAEHYYKFIKNGRIHLESHLPTLIESEFGWLVSGRAETSTNTYSVVCHVNTMENLENKIEKFWRIEEVQSQNYSVEERKCEEIYQQTTTRNEEGRYVVQLPKRDNFQDMIGESKEVALKRFQYLERKFEKNPSLKSEYDKFMLEYLQLGHMELINERKLDSPNECYLPHHAVFKEDSTTTKVRVVFDGSAKTSTGFSLNQALLVGPVVQQELLAIVTRFRKHRIALVADAEKMYRQTLVAPSDRPFQKILYRFRTSEPVQTYTLNTVTYGLSPSSFLATRTLLQLAADEGGKYPLAKAVLEKDFYVDDLISGEESEEKAIQLRNELNELLAKGGFTLRKWCSNSLEVLAGLAPGQSATQSTLKFEEEESIKTLGILWEPSTDCFRFDISIQQEGKEVTKRHVLSQIAQLFDPLGLIAPIIFKAKVIMQQLWTLSLNWDDVIPPTIEHQWESFLNQLHKLVELRIPRYAFSPGSEFELHCFVDASTLGYGACIYARSNGLEKVKISLLASKSRVAPLKRVTLPRLELCAALLGARLYEKIIQALDMRFQSVTFWSDSTIALHWLRAPPHNWKTFVANRVSEIQSITHAAKWFHISGLDNPADLVSRGLHPEEILGNRKWFEGPDWLAKPSDSWPINQPAPDLPSDLDLEVHVSNLSVQATTIIEPNHLFTRFSDYIKLINVISYCMRFIHGICTKTQKVISIAVTPEEQSNALRILARLAQKEVFSEEIKQLKKNSTVLKHSKLKLLNPFLDKDNILRVGGRLKLSQESYSVKHPIILPGFHPFTKLIIKDRHRKLMHGGISSTLAYIRDEFWLTNGRRAIRSVLRKCYKCTRADPRPMHQPMGQLPPARIQCSRPFSTTGVDFCGPVFVKAALRKSTAIKAYIAIFVCFSTKAVHIELVSDLSTAAFLSAFRRFIARRGKPEHVYSDNGTNFIGAKNELHAIYQMLHSKDEENIARTLAHEGITWHLIPPRAPNFGGLWEAAVKVAKRHMIRQIGGTSLLHEDLITLLAQIEACMNSRPLMPMTEDASDLEVLTPGHFLIGSSMQALPEANVREIRTNRLNRFQLIQQKNQHFWDRWRAEYLREQNRQASRNPRAVQLKVDQLVILQDQFLPPCRWPIARIVELHPGSDGIQRVATIRTASGTFKRPISKLCPLPSAEDDNEEGDEESNNT